MVLARVKGTVVATHKSPPMEGLKLLLLEKIDPVTLKGKGDFVVGIDSVGANAGEIVFYVTGSSARMTDTTKGKPSDATIIAIVDAIEKDGALTYDKAAPHESAQGSRAQIRPGVGAMNIARVRGTVVATQRSDKVDGARFLLVEECDQGGTGRSEYLVALDLVGADRGQLVLLTQGSSCRWTFRTDDRPMDTLVVAIVDTIDERGVVTYSGQG